jgi:hypothetical protein
VYLGRIVALGKDPRTAQQVAAPDCGHSVFLIPNGVAALVSHRPFKCLVNRETGLLIFEVRTKNHFYG